jgi:hypothetical protein
MKPRDSTMTSAELDQLAKSLIYPGKQPIKAGKGWLTSCPCEGHGKGQGDQNPSLKISLKNGYLQVFCKAGTCKSPQIKAAIKTRGLGPKGGSRSDDTDDLSFIPLPHAPAGTELTIFEHHQWKKPHHLWVYRTSVGLIHGAVSRWDNVGDQDKVFGQIRWVRNKDTGNESWYSGPGIQVQGFYGEELLDERPNAPVLVVSGEKTCDAARRLFPDHVALTWAGGDTVVERQNWALLDLRRVTLLPDNDDSSRTAMRQAAVKLTKHGAKSVQVVDVTELGLEPGWDVADKFPVGLDADKLLAKAMLWTGADQLEAVNEFKKEIIWNNEDKAELVGTLNKIYAVVGEAKPMVYHEVLSPEGDFEVRRLTPRGVIDVAMYDQRVSIGTDDNPRIVTPGAFWYAHPQRRTYPNGPIFWVKGDVPEGYYNLFRGFSVEPNENGDCGLFLEHIRENVWHNNKAHFEWFMGYHAHLIQHPEEKPGVAIFLVSLWQGIGKSIVFQIFGRLLGKHYQEFEDLGPILGKFNSRMANMIYAQAEEISAFLDSKELAVLKNRITSPEQKIEHKGIDAYYTRSFLRIVGTSNRISRLPISPEDRRFCIQEVLFGWTDEVQGTRKRKQKLRDGVPIFEAMLRQLEQGGYGKLLHILQNWDLSKWRAEDYPRTEALSEYRAQQLSKPLAFYREILTEQAEKYFFQGNIDGELKAVVVIGKERLYDDYCSWVKNPRDLVDRAIFHKELQSAWPDKLFIETDNGRQVKLKKGPRPHRVWFYEVLPLAEHREAFKEKTGASAVEAKATEMKETTEEDIRDLYDEKVAPFKPRRDK